MAFYFILSLIFRLLVMKYKGKAVITWLGKTCQSHPAADICKVPLLKDNL